MKISLNWLKSFIKISKDPSEVGYILTEVGLEVDAVLEINPDKKYLSNLVVGEIKKISKHPNADRLSSTEVQIGEEILSIICGANNIEVGKKVVIAKPGSKIKNTSGQILEIKKAKIRGLESNGMICAEDEIGVGNSHSEIIILDQSSKKVIIIIII